MVVSHIIFLRRYVLEGVPDLITLDHRVGTGRLGRKRGGVSARGFKGLAAAWTERANDHSRHLGAKYTVV